MSGMNWWWADVLLCIYTASRGLPRWDVVYSCHDSQDQGYFDMLDEKLGPKEPEIPGPEAA